MNRGQGPRTARSELVEISRELYQRGWVANHDGNVTARLGPDRFLATPTSTSKRRVDERSLLEVDGRGERVAGSGRAFGEIGIHLAIYQRRDDVSAVVHAHPPYATALACSGSRVLERPFIAEAVVSLGPRIPTVPFAAPGAAARDALAQEVDDHDAVLVANHGAFAWGASVEQAFLRLELVEHLARIATLAQATGGVAYLPDTALPPLLEARAKAGLGKASERAVAGAQRPVVACTPAPHSSTPTIAPGRKLPGHAEITAVVRDEILRALRHR